MAQRRPLRVDEHQHRIIIITTKHGTSPLPLPLPLQSPQKETSKTILVLLLLLLLIVLILILYYIDFDRLCFRLNYNIMDIVE